MPVLAAYAPQPIHSAAWASMNPNPRFSSSTSSRFQSVVVKVSPVVRRPTRQKRCKSQLEKMSKSMAVSLECSKKNKHKKSSVATEDSSHGVTPCNPVIKSILIKPSTSLINFYQSNSPVPVPGSEIALVAGSTSARCPSESTSCNSVVKKVRFSVAKPTRPQISAIQRQLSNFHPQSTGDLASNESDLLYHDSHLEPVSETVFFTHSRYSYDRSPITVDKVLNKALDLPPRNPIDAFSAGRWLPKSGPTNHYGAGEVPFHLVLCNQAENCAATESTDELNLNTLSAIPRAIATSDNSVIHNTPRADSRMAGLGCRDARLELHRGDSEDGSNDSSPLLTGPECCTELNWLNNFSTRNSSLALNPTETLTGEEQHLQITKNYNSSSIMEENLTCHSLSNLKIEETLDGIEDCILEVDEIFGIGNWTRAQLFGSCDALDGF